MDVMQARTSQAEERRSETNPAGESMSIFCVGAKKKSVPDFLLSSYVLESFLTLLKVMMVGDDF